MLVSSSTGETIKTSNIQESSQHSKVDSRFLWNRFFILPYSGAVRLLHQTLMKQYSKVQVILCCLLMLVMDNRKYHNVGPPNVISWLINASNYSYLRTINYTYCSYKQT